MAAHSLGRLRQAIGELRPGADAASPPTTPTPSSDGASAAREDFLSGESGTVGGLDAVRRRARDELLDALDLARGRRLRLARAARRAPPRRRVLVLSVQRPERRAMAAAIAAELARSRHDVELRVGPPGEAGKFENLNRLLARVAPSGPNPVEDRDPIGDYDWLLAIDDDVVLPRGFLDRLLFLAERFALDLAQPAHRAASHAAWRVTRRRRGAVARETPFVEIGPVTAFARSTFPALLPFPPLRMGWGLDLHWARARARARLALRCARRGRDPPLGGAGRRCVLARGRDRRGPRLPGRAPLRERPRGPAHPRHPPPLVKVAVVAEFYPRRGDPVLGVWAHRQALAARAAGAQVHIVVLHRLVPPRSSLTAGPSGMGRALRGLLEEPRRQIRDGLAVTYVPYVSPTRERHYPAWGAWAAPPLGRALRRLRRREGIELVHAHNAVPAGDAVRRAGLDVPVVVSVHGGDVLYTAPRSPAGRAAVARGLGAARLVLANSRGIAELARAHGAADVEVVHLGTDMPASGIAGDGRPDRAHQTETLALVTVGHLVARKRHADVLRALAVLSSRHPALRYVIVGDGPERVALEGLATRLGVASRVELCGQLSPAAAIERARRCTLFAMPSTEEAFGVAYIEAMAGGLPAIGCRGEPGPEEIAAAGDGFVLVPPGDIERLTQRIDELLSDPHRLREAGRRARATVAGHFTWERCGRQTVAAYERALR